MYVDASASLARWTGHFGLSPSTRAGVDVVKAGIGQGRKDVDEAAALFG